MVWTRLDDGFFANPKIVRLGNVAFRLYVSALNWSVAHLTDGHIPEHIDLIVLPLEKPRSRSAAVDELMESGLWAHNGVGFVIHDFGDYQESKETVAARREKWANRKKTTRSPTGSPPRTPPETPSGSPRPPRARSHPIPLEEAKASSRSGLWQTLDELFGPVSESHRSRRGKIVKGLTGLGATPEQMRARHAAWDRLFPHKITITDTALEKFWGNLGLLVAAESKPLADCDVCRNRRQVGQTVEGYVVAWDDEDAVTWKPCRCVKGATK